MTSSKWHPLLLKHQTKVRLEENDIKIITGDFLMDILFDRLTGMDSETKKILGISSVPQFFG